MKNNYITEQFNNFVLDSNHPCLMAKSIFSSEEYILKTYQDFGSRKAARSIINDLTEYLEQYDFSTMNFQTFIAVFPDEKIPSEALFEKLMWSQLQQIHNLDENEWDAGVSDDPSETDFSFSLGGQAFYIVGMHPASSRKARQSPAPCMVFNLHWQFEELRRRNIYQQLRDRIRRRDKNQNGSINPMLKDFGQQSEAKQYSGRAVNDDWTCPFKSKSE